MSEIFYDSEALKLEKDQYLFKPGESADLLYVVAEGALDLSITINEKHLHFLKKNLNYKDIERSPQKKRRDNKYDNYATYHFDISQMKSLKHKAEIIPYFNDKSPIGSMGYEDTEPKGTISIGNYPQEIVIETLGSGTLISPFFILCNQIHQLQCKAIQPSTVYVIKGSYIEKLTQFHSEFKKSFKKALLSTNQKSSDPLDYLIIGQKNKNPAKRWKSAIIRVLLNSRENRRKFLAGYGVMLSKLRAVSACEKSKNFDLADKVINGLINPDLILDDGTIDLSNAQSYNLNFLPKNHPVLKNFDIAISSVLSIEGEITKDYEFLRRNFAKQNNKLAHIGNQIEDIHQRLTVVADILLKDRKSPNRGLDKLPKIEISNKKFTSPIGGPEEIKRLEEIPYFDLGEQ